MAFLRIEKKKSGSYLRVVESYKEAGKPKHRTLFSMGKVEDYPNDQLERIASKLLELSGTRIEDVMADDLTEVGRQNYGYCMIIQSLWKTFGLDKWAKKVNSTHRVRFNWLNTLELMIAQRINEPCSKHACFQQQQEYIGFADQGVELQHFYRCLDILSKEQESLKAHMANASRGLFSQELDVVFYDVTTLYFESQKEEAENLRQKGYSKDGKAHKTQVVLGLLVDKLRNPISYHIYKGNTYEGRTMLDALAELQKVHSIDKAIVVADSAMIDKDNRAFMDGHPKLDYILGDRIKNLPKAIGTQLIHKANHQPVHVGSTALTYAEVEHQGRRIICTYSEKRARKDAHARGKLIDKATALLEQPAKLKQATKRGAGRYLKQTANQSYGMDIQKIEEDAKWDGYKAIATTTDLPVAKLLGKYADLFEVEHAFRTLKSQLQIRPMFHWTNQRIEGHIAMCFLAFSFLNYMRNKTGLQNKELIYAMDQMQLSEVKEKQSNRTLYLRSKISPQQRQIIQNLKLVVPKDTTPQVAINQYFNPIR